MEFVPDVFGRFREFLQLLDTQYGQPPNDQVVAMGLVAALLTVAEQIERVADTDYVRRGRE